MIASKVIESGKLLTTMGARMKDEAENAASELIEKARRAFRAFRTLCFWSWAEEPEINEVTIPLIVEGLRKYGGHKGYRAAAELCRWRVASPGVELGCALSN